METLSNEPLETLMLSSSPEDIKRAAEIIRRGGLVGMPTETVYGLAADALNGKAVSKIFRAKGRPGDNPLIVHVAAFEDIEKYKLVREIPEKAKILADKYWPGPLTIIMKKSDIIPDEVSAGLDTVAVRIPSHPVAASLIREAKTPIAAPSANLSGSPSPTTAQHVMNDMKGRIEAVIDGGESSVGVESTVITLAGEKPRLLRPGGITLEQLRAALGEVEMDDAVLHKLKEGAAAASPGMKYKHYAPKAEVIILKGSSKAYIDYVNSHIEDGTAALCWEEDIEKLKCKALPMGCKKDQASQAHHLFEELREIDSDESIKKVFARCPDTEGIGLAVYNRLIRAAGFEVIELEKI